MKYSLVFSASISMLIWFFQVDPLLAQQVPEEQVIYYTEEWEGERDSYGRPLVSDNILERMEYVSLEEAWGTIRGAEYEDKFEGDWEIMRPREKMVGRALTSTYVPAVPELEERMEEDGHAEGHRGPMNQWPIEMLEEGDVYVADGFGKIKWGTLIGDNLGRAIYANSGNGIVFYGSSRDLEGLREIDGFNAWVKGWDPTFIQNMTLISINGPTRIGAATVLPGDVVLATETGVLFIPPHLAEDVVVSSEVTRTQDIFRQLRIGEGTYELGEVYGVEWTEAIEEDYYSWLETERTWLNEEHGIGYETIDQLVETQSRDWREW